MAVCSFIFAEKQMIMAKIENIRWLSGFIHGLGELAIKQGRKTLYGLINTAARGLHPGAAALLYLPPTTSHPRSAVGTR